MRLGRGTGRERVFDGGIGNWEGRRGKEERCVYIRALTALAWVVSYWHMRTVHMRCVNDWA